MVYNPLYTGDLLQTMKTQMKCSIMLHLIKVCIVCYVEKTTFTCLQIRVCTGILFFLFLNQDICCGCSKEPSQLDDSFEHPKHMFQLIGKEINAIF